MPAGYSDEEFAQFTKTERRILALLVDMKYENEQIMNSLDIKPVTFRGHMAHIKKKRAEIMTLRFNNQAKVETKRQEEVSLPDYEPDLPEDEEVGGPKKVPHEDEPPPIHQPGVDMPEAFSPSRVQFEKIPAEESLLPKQAFKEKRFGSL